MTFPRLSERQHQLLQHAGKVGPRECRFVYEDGRTLRAINALVQLGLLGAVSPVISEAYPGGRVCELRLTEAGTKALRQLRQQT